MVLFRQIHTDPFAEAVTEIDWKKQSITLARTNELDTGNKLYTYQEVEEKLCNTGKTWGIGCFRLASVDVG